MTQQLRIAMIGSRGLPASYGGVERAVEELSVRLAMRGHDVTVYCRTQYCEVRDPEYRGVHLRYLPALDTKHFEAITHTAVATVDALVRRFDVIHFHATGPALLVPLARASRASVVATVQGLDYERAKWGRLATSILRVGAWSAARFPHQTIVVSKELRRHFRDHYGRDALYAPNGVMLPPPEIEQPPFGLQYGRYLLFLGRLVPEKAVHLLIRAYRPLATKLPLVIAGLSSHSDEYVQSLQREAAGDERIRFVGAVYGREKQALFAGALAFCQPSELEGLPIALLEAMSFGRPPIVSDIPEHLEIVRDEQEEVGFVFRTGDVDSLRVTLAQALGDKRELERRGARAREIVAAHYDWDLIVDRVESAYLGLVPRSRSAIGVAA